MSKIVSKERTTNYFKQVKGSFLFKILSVLASFLIIPIMIQYLGVEQYGIWSTLLSIVSWIVLFDIGIGNGLRNKISESLANSNKKEAQKYISTAYVTIGIISFLLLSIVLTMSNYISWQSVFNTQILENDELIKVLQVTFVFIFLNFWLSLINQVFNGIQKTSLVVLNQFISNSLSLLFIYLLNLYTEPSLLKLASFYGISLVVSNIILSIWFYGKNIDLRPKLQNSSKKHMKSITSLGLQFFIIQIAVIAIFTTDKILITQLFGPEYVTEYDIVFKLFTSITILHGILLAPLWNAYSDAFHRKDYIWIKNTLKKQLFIWFFLILATIFLVLTSPYIISLWIGSEYTVDSKLIYAIGGFILVSTWNNIFAYFLNAINILKLQINTSIVAIIINIPISIILVKYFGLSIYGIVIGTIIALSIFAVFGSIKTYKILRGYSE